MHGTLCLLHRNHGDTVLAEWTDEATAEGARKLFDEYRAKGCMLYAIGGPGDSRPLLEFDMKCARILIVPLIQGG